MTYLDDICDDLATRELRQLPQSAVHTAKLALVDYFAVAIAGSQHHDVQGIARMITDKGGSGRAAILGTALRTVPENAALHNGFAAHVFDYDDFSIINHPTAPVAPAAFAVAESRGGSGADVLRSYLLAGEVMYRIARQCLPFTSDQGWHTTGVFGVLGASVAAALAARRSTTEVAAALGIATSEASGLRGNFGSPVKAFHCGMAARTGVWCSDLAAAGLRPSPHIIEGIDGFFQLFGGIAPNTVAYTPSESWSILEPGINLKRYACCSSMGPAIDALLESSEVSELNPEQIVSIDVAQTPWSYKELVYPFPTSAAESKFSMEYAIAAALVFRRADLDIFNDDTFVRDPAIRSLMTRVETRIDDELASSGFTADAPVRIEIRLRNGRSIHLARAFARGNVKNPLTEDQRIRKYYALAEPVIGGTRAERLLQRLLELESIENVAHLLGD